MQENKKFSMSVSPNIITEVLGRDLAEDYSIVLAEQIKNAKDAKATKVEINFDLPEKITIIDNGKGTSIDKISSTWLTAGTNNKVNDIESLGGKGIGRFLLFSLGNEINVQTIFQNMKSEFSLNKEDLQRENDIENKEISVKTTLISGSSNHEKGTKIVIKDIIPELINYDKLKIDLENLVLDSENFDISINPSKKIEFLKWDTAKKYARLSSKSSIKIIDGKVEFNYESNAKISKADKTIAIDSDSELIKEAQKYINEHINVFKEIGPFTFELIHFYDKNMKEGFSIKNSDIRERFLSYNAGINIYRKGFKIFGYGLNDWLDLENAARNKTSRISNSRSAGRILLDPMSESVLIERSSRESLITTKTSYKVFRDLILLIIDILNSDRGKLISKAKENIDSKKNDNTDNTIEDKDIGKPTTNDGSEATKDDFTPILNLKRAKSYNINNSIDLSDLVDFDSSYKEKGKHICKFDLDFEYEIEGEKYIDNFIKAQDHPCMVSGVIGINDLGLKKSFSFEIRDNNKSMRSPLFIKHGSNDFCKFKKLNEDSFSYLMIQQLNELWKDTSSKYDLVISASIRSIVDGQIQDLKEGLINYNLINLTGNFGDIKEIIDFLVENKQKIIQSLKINSNDAANFFRKIEFLENKGESGEIFKEKLKMGHTGAHDPTSLGSDNIINIAKNTIDFLDVCELVEKYIKKK